MPPSYSLSSRARTVAGTPNSRDLAGARAPLLSHTTARSRQASTSFESQATRAGRRLESQPTGTPQRYEPGSLPSRPGSQRLPTIGRIPARPGRLALVTGSDPVAGPPCGPIAEYGVPEGAGLRNLGSAGGGRRVRGGAGCAAVLVLLPPAVRGAAAVRAAPYRAG